jgi:hypothetical protein
MYRTTSISRQKAPWPLGGTILVPVLGTVATAPPRASTFTPGTQKHPEEPAAHTCSSGTAASIFCPLSKKRMIFYKQQFLCPFSCIAHFFELTWAPR